MIAERTEPAEVACNGCTLCCRSGELILLDVNDPLYPDATVEIEVNGHHLRALKQHADGSCIFVQADGCAVHDDAPAVCKVFDCAGLYASKTRRQRRTMAARDPSGYVAKLYARGRELHRLRIGSQP